MVYGVDGSLEKIFFVDILTFVITILIVTTSVWLTIKTFILTKKRLKNPRPSFYSAIAGIIFAMTLAFFAYVFFSSNYFGMGSGPDRQFWLEEMVMNLQRLQQEGLDFLPFFHWLPFMVLALYIANIILVFLLLKICKKAKQTVGKNTKSRRDFCTVAGFLASINKSAYGCILFLTMYNLKVVVRGKPLT